VLHFTPDARYLGARILADLTEKMVFLGGPRQVGKTTLARSLLPSALYSSWDDAEDRSRIPKLYQVHLGEADFGDEAREGRVLPLHRLCELEQLP